MWKLSAPTGGDLHRLCLCGFGGTREAAGLAPLLFNLRERLQAGRKQTELRWGVSEFMEMVPWLLGQCQPWFLTEGQCAVPTWPLPRVFSHSGTAETILTLSTQECSGPHAAKTVNSSPSYIQCNTKERKYDKHQPWHNKSFSLPCSHFRQVLDLSDLGHPYIQCLLALLFTSLVFSFLYSALLLLLLSSH